MDDTLSPADVALINGAVLQLGRRLRAERPRPSPTVAALALLSTLYRRGPMPAADLARAERLQPQSLSRLIVRLEGEDLIERTPHPVDRRVIILGITPKGLGMLNRDMEARRAWLAREMAERLTPEEQAALLAAASAMMKLAAAPLPPLHGEGQTA